MYVEDRTARMGFCGRIGAYALNPCAKVTEQVGIAVGDDEMEAASRLDVPIAHVVTEDLGRDLVEMTREDEPPIARILHRLFGELDVRLIRENLFMPA